MKRETPQRQANKTTGNSRMTDSDLSFSIIIPCKDEAENIGILIDEISEALTPCALADPFEVIIIDDGSTDNTIEAVSNLKETRPWLRLLVHDQCAGQSAGLRSGLLAARGKIVALLDGDGQNNPAYLPQLLEIFDQTGPKVGMVAGQRVQRTDGFIKKHASRFANGLRGRMLKDQTRDSGNGLKAFRREVWLSLPYFDHWHRFLPALVVREGYELRFIDVVDRPRRFGQSKYGVFDRALVGIVDLFGVWWLRKRRKVIPAVRENRD